MITSIDATAFVGDYPFRGFGSTTSQALKERAGQYGVGQAIVSSFQELFWENNFDATTRLADELRGDDFFIHFAAVNPTYPGQLKALPQLVEQTGIKGLRIFPNYHGYRLWDTGVLELFQLATQLDLPVQVVREIQDQRMHWMHTVPPVSNADFDWLFSAIGSEELPACRLLLSALPFGELTRLASVLRDAPTVWTDLSRVRGPVFAVEKLVNDHKLERLVYGTLSPIQVVAASYRQIEHAAINDQQRAAILSGNCQRFLTSSQA